MSELLENSAQRYPDNIAASFVDGSHSYSYATFKARSFELSATLTRCGVGAGDKVVILSENCPEWGIAMMAAAAFGRVFVPILPDCSALEVNNIIAHSGARAAFVSAKQMSKLSAQSREKMAAIFDMASLSITGGCMKDGTDGESGTERKDGASGNNVSPDDLAAILYTSGTSGSPKGVMLSHGNLCHNIVCAPGVHRATTDDIWLSFLPMAHTYELSLAMLYPFESGARVYYLDKAPTPSVIIKAVKAVRPTLICSVPLIIEKIYKHSVLPKIHKSAVMSLMSKVAPGLTCRIVGKRLLKTFGGKLKVFAIGGAKLDREVESFLHRAHFPYAIGYGLTETAPLVCAAAVGQTSVGSTGFALEGVQVKLLDPDPQTGLGELCVKGPNVMMGYYKDPAKTQEVFTKDGWFRTKDVASIQADGRVSIVGRIGNMIVGPSGENIYPEDIEMVLNGQEGVEESIVKSEKGRLVALVKMMDGAAADEEVKARLISGVNSRLNKASQIYNIEFVAESFEKTATRKIRRFKYL